MPDFRVVFARCVHEDDERAWDAFWSLERPWLRRVLIRTLRELGRPLNLSDLEDLEQEVYLRVLSRAARHRLRIACRSEGHVRAYLIRVAESVVIDHLRRRGAEKRKGPMAQSMGKNAIEVQAAREVDPEAWTLVREHVREIVRGCRAVAGRKDQRAKVHALTLVLFGGYASGEAARNAGGEVTAGSIDTMVSRARSRLRERGIELPRRRRAIADLPRAA